MIARLRGTLIEQLSDRLVVECGGVGYDVQVPESVAFQLGALGDEVCLWIRHIVREDGMFLYGFASAQDRQLFDMLRDVKGCGPKTSLALLATLGVDSVVVAIRESDHRALARAPGVGPRLAERIAIELRDAVANLAVAASSPRTTTVSVPEDNAVVSALIALGYRRTEAEAAAAAVADSGDEAAQVRAALQRLRQ